MYTTYDRSTISTISTTSISTKVRVVPAKVYRAQVMEKCIEDKLWRTTTRRAAAQCAKPLKFDKLVAAKFRNKKLLDLECRMDDNDNYVAIDPGRD